MTFATIPNDAVLLNLAEHLLQENPPCSEKATALVGLVRVRGALEKVGLRVANLLISHGQLDAARKIITEVNCDAYLQNALKADEVSLLLQVLVKLNRLKKVLAFFDQATLSSRFGSYEAMDIRLKIANLLLLQNRPDAAERVITDLEAQAYFHKATGIGNIKLLFNVLMGTGHSDICCDLVEDLNAERRFSRFEVLDIRLNLAVFLLNNNRKGRARNVLQSMDGKHYLAHVSDIQQFLKFFLVMCDSKSIKNFSGLLLGDFLEQHFKYTAIIDIKVRIVSRCIMQGERETARQILVTIPIDSIRSPDVIEQLGTAYILLEMFDTARMVFEVGERRKIISKLFYMRQALLHICLWEHDKLRASIENDRRENGSSDLNTYVLAFLLARQGRYEEADRCIDALVDNPNAGMDLQLAGLTLKGNILRSMGACDKALSYYAQATSGRQYPSIWWWVALFEYAMTLFYVDQIDQAMSKAEEGKNYSIPFADASFNPCLFLNHYLVGRFASGSDRSFDATIDCRPVASWPQPHTPYKMWMYLLSGFSMDEAGETELADAAITAIVADPVHTEPSQRKGLQERFSNACLWRNTEFLDALSLAIWPRQAPNFFESRIFHRLWHGRSKNITYKLHGFKPSIYRAC